jgi:hypothetical protein
MILHTLKNSTITRMELFYQHRGQSWRNPLVNIVDGVMTVFALYGIVVGIAALSFGINDRGEVRALLFCFYWALVTFHFGLMLKTLHRSAAAITREKRDSERWESLLLTGISGREIVFGKWWATVQTMWRSYLFLAFLRAAAVLTLCNVGIGILPMVEEAPRSDPISVSVWSILLGVGLVSVMTLVNLPFTAACGVMSAMDAKRGAGLARGAVARFLITVIAAFVPVVVWHLIGYVFLVHIGVLERFVEADVRYMFAEYFNTLLDNGFSLSGYVVMNPRWLQNNSVGIFVAVVLVLAMYGVLTWGLLRVAQWRAEGSGALKYQESR